MDQLLTGSDALFATNVEELRQTVKPSVAPGLVAEMPLWVEAFFAGKERELASLLAAGVDLEVLDRYRGFVEPGWDKKPLEQNREFSQWVLDEYPVPESVGRRA